jgi:hypothetical protein
MNPSQTVRHLSLLALLTVAAGAATGAEPLNIKPGLWQMSTTTALSGSMLPPALLAQMPPEQRARIEANLKQQGAGGHAGSSKSCITKEDLERGSVHTDKAEDQKDCKYRVVSQTATHMETHFQCTGEGARDGEMRFDAVSPEQIKGAVQVTTAHGKVTVQLDGHWLGASCAGAKD